MDVFYTRTFGREIPDDFRSVPAVRRTRYADTAATRPPHPRLPEEFRYYDGRAAIINAAAAGTFNLDPFVNIVRRAVRPNRGRESTGAHGRVQATMAGNDATCFLKNV